jgi:hypothetical protein
MHKSTTRLMRIPAAAGEEGNREEQGRITHDRFPDSPTKGMFTFTLQYRQEKQ